MSKKMRVSPVIREINKAELVEKHKKRFLGCQEKAKNRQKVLIPYCKGLNQIFYGSAVQGAVEELTAKWENNRFNKELVHAAEELKSTLIPLQVDYEPVRRYNLFLKLLCHEHGIGCFEELRI